MSIIEGSECIIRIASITLERPPPLMVSALGRSAHLTLEAFACAATQRVAVAVVNGMIDLLDGGRAGCHAAFA